MKFISRNYWVAVLEWAHRAEWVRWWRMLIGDNCFLFSFLYGGISRCSLHVSCVAKIDAWLSGTFVWSILKWDDILASLHLLVGEVANIFLSFFWSNAWFAKVVSLKKNKLINIRSLKLFMSTHFSAQRLQADDDRVQVLTLPQINRLECLLNWNTECLRTLKESRNIFHTLESHFTLVDFLHRAGLQCIR